MLEIDERIRWPKFYLHLLAAHHFARGLQQHQQHLKRLPVQFYFCSVFTKLAGTNIYFKIGEPIDLGWFRHVSSRTVRNRDSSIAPWGKPYARPDTRPLTGAGPVSRPVWKRSQFPGVCQEHGFTRCSRNLRSHKLRDLHDRVPPAKLLRFPNSRAPYQSLAASCRNPGLGNVRLAKVLARSAAGRAGGKPISIANVPHRGWMRCSPPVCIPFHLGRAPLVRKFPGSGFATLQIGKRRRQDCRCPPPNRRARQLRFPWPPWYWFPN